MNNEEIRQHLYEMQDEKYRDFQAKLIPNIDPKSMIGVRTPVLRDFAKKLLKEGDTAEFLGELPHRTFDENQLHAFIISEMKDYADALREVERFLPYIDNWATCDQMSPKAFRKNREALLPGIRGWIASDRVYTIRFGICMLMSHYLDDAFDPEYPELVAAVRSDEYYVNMMIAWYFATALAKRWVETLPYIAQERLDLWAHNKAIQKAIESRRITPEQKELLRGMKRKK